MWWVFWRYWGLYSLWCVWGGCSWRWGQLLRRLCQPRLGAWFCAVEWGSLHQRNGGYGTGCGGRADRPGRGVPGCGGLLQVRRSVLHWTRWDGEPEEPEELLRTGVTVCFPCRLTWKCLTEKRFPLRLSKALKLLIFHLGNVTIWITCEARGGSCVSV